MLVLATGLVLWWPGLKKLPLGFQVRSKRSNFLALYDAHKLLGLLTAPLGLLMAATGFLLTFHTLAMLLTHGITSSQPLYVPTADQLRCHPQESQGLTPEEWQRIAERAIQGAQVTYVAFPASPTAAVQLRLRVTDCPHPNGTGRVWLNPYSGEILYVHDPRSYNVGNRLYAKWMFPLHIGTYGGSVTRTLHAVAGLSIVVLAGTGSAMWLNRRIRSRHFLRQRT